MEPEIKNQQPVERLEQLIEMSMLMSVDAYFTKVWLRETVLGLCTKQDKVTVASEVLVGVTVFHVWVDDDDAGKLIGKKGRNVQAIRVLLLARGKAMGERYDLHVHLPADNPNQPLREMSETAKEAFAQTVTEPIVEFGFQTEEQVQEVLRQIRKAPFAITDKPMKMIEKFFPTRKEADEIVFDSIDFSIRQALRIR